MYLTRRIYGGNKCGSLSAGQFFMDYLVGCMSYISFYVIKSLFVDLVNSYFMINQIWRNGYEVFFMFSGEKVLVDLRCDNSLMKTMVDRFGEDVTTLAYDMTSFRVQTEVSASPTFFGWVFGFNGKVQILAPESVKEQYRQMIAKADEDMQESE